MARLMRRRREAQDKTKAIMQRGNLDERNLQPGLPGLGQGMQPQVLAQAFEVLVPGIAEACPELVGAAKIYIFQKDGPLRRRQCLELHALLDACAGQGLEVEKDLLFTIFEGLAAIADAHKLGTEAALERFFQAHKEAFRPLFF